MRKYMMKSKEVYPDGLHRALADGLGGEGFAIRTATLDQPTRFE